MKRYLKIKGNKGITLIALVITIIILLILAGISISSLTGSGLFERAKEASEKSKQAQYEEELNLVIATMKTDSIIKNEEFNMENIIKKLPEYLDEEGKDDYDWDITQAPDYPEGEYKGYSFYIDDNYQVHVEEKINGIKPDIEVEALTKELTSENVDIEVIASITEGTVILQEPENITLKTQVSDTHKIFTVSKNGKYTFIAIGDSGRKARKTVNITNIIEKPEIEITEIDDTKCKINIINGIEDGIYTYYLDETAKISNTTETSITINDLNKETKYSVYVTLNYNSEIIKSDTKEFTTTNTTESLEKIVLTTSGFVNAYKKDPKTNEIIGRVLDKTIPYTTLREYSWADYYDVLYNAFDGDIESQAVFGANTVTGSHINGTSGGLIEIEEDCIGKFINVYVGFPVIKFYNQNKKLIKSIEYEDNNNINQIKSIRIDEETKFIEMYRGGAHLNGVRTIINEIFLTDNEITEEQTINDFFKNK